MSAVPSIALERVMAPKRGSVDPSAFPDEEFDLYSIPAFDQGAPETLLGNKIGSTKQVVQPGDVLLSRIVPHIRRAWIVGPNRNRRIIASGEWLVFRGKEIEPRYLRHVLIGDPFHAEFMRTVSGVGGSLLRARPRYVAKIHVPLPSLSEQRRIAAILDKADALRAKRHAALAKLDELTQSIFLGMFGDPASNPKRWQVGTLRSLGQVITGTTPPSARAGMFGGPVPFVTPGDLESGNPVKRTVTEEGAMASRTVKEGATLVCCIGATIGKMSNTPVRSAFNQQINAVQWGPDVEPHYGLACMRFFKPKIIAWGASTTLPILKKSTFEQIEIPVPPYAPQRAFARLVENIQQLESNHKSSLRVAETLFASLQHRAFRGDL